MDTSLSYIILTYKVPLLQATKVNMGVFSTGGGNSISNPISNLNDILKILEIKNSAGIIIKNEIY